MTAALLEAHQADELFPQNWRQLHKEFQLIQRVAKQIILQCPDCQMIGTSPPSMGVNLRGLWANDLWQMDVTHMPLLGDSHMYT